MGSKADGAVAGADFVGRQGEVARLRRAWDAARSGEARIVGVEGAPGIGKTALVRHFLAAADPVTLVRVSGDEEEAALPWGVLAQIARAMPGSRAVAARGSRDAQADPVFVGQALADDLRDTKNAILVVDDAHWGDRLSMTAVRLAARRLLGDSVLVIVIYQSPGETGGIAAPRLSGGLDDAWRRMFDPDRGDHFRLAGLSAAEVVRLAVACGHPGLSPAGAARLHEHTGGHPLHVRHLLDELPMHLIVFGHGTLPAPAGIAMAIRSRLSSCQPQTRDLVAAGAVIGRRFSLAQIRDLADISGTSDAVAEAIGARLLEEVPGSAGQELAFTSSQVRGLVYHDLASPRRRGLHRRAAARGGTGVLWHRIAAADGPDPGLADDIERGARTYLTRGQIPLAAVHLRHALNLTPSGPARTARLLATVEAMLVTGDIASTVEYREELASGSGAWPDYVAGYQLLLIGEVAEARSRLGRALAAVRHRAQAPALEAPDLEPPDLEARIATQLAIIGVITVSYPDMVEYGAAAVATAREPWVAAFAWFARSLGLAVAGRGAEALTELADVAAPGAPSGLDGLVARGIIRLWTDDLAGAHRDLTTAVNRATRGETLRVGQALGFLGEVEYRLGAFGEAALHTELAVGDAEENSRVWDYALVHGLASYPLAAQAEWERAEAHAEQAARWARLVAAPAGLAYAAASQAAIAQARGDAARLLAAAEELESIYPALEPGTHLVAALRADALSQLGRTADAIEALDAFTAKVASSGHRSAQLSITRVRAQIAAATGARGEAVRECQQALQLAREIGLPLEAARIELLTGTYHAAAGRRAAAERCLRAALRQFTALGAGAYVTQTLRAADRAGLGIAAPPAVLDALTPAERAVVTLVCHGLSNKEIAERLVLSTKTVEFHLTNVFRRLDVGTRGELRQVVADSSLPAAADAFRCLSRWVIALAQGGCRCYPGLRRGISRGGP